MGYLIDLHETQRRVIAKALAKCTEADFDQKEGTGQVDFLSEAAEFTMLVKMFNDLPKIEEENPGVMHGFAL